MTAAQAPAHPDRRAALAWYAAFIAFSAYAGAVGLAGGAIDTRGTIDARLPFHSSVFGAIALTIVVGVPNTVLAVCAWRGDDRTGLVALTAGALLVGWIAVEIAFIRELSFLQPAYVAVGASLVVIGRKKPSGLRSRRQPAQR